MRAFFIFCLLLSQLVSFSQTKHADLILKDISIVDIEHNKVQPHQTVVINNGRILEVGNAAISKKY